MAYYRSGTQKPIEAGNGIDITDETISLKQASTTEFGAAKIDGTSISVNASGQIKKLKTQKVTLSASTSETYIGVTDTITATASAGGTLSATSSDNSVATASVSNGEVTIIGVAIGSCVIIVTAAATGDYGQGENTISVEVSYPIYGVEWDGSSSPAWTRTDAAVDFSDPNPYYEGMESTSYSPFDNISPWKDIRIVEDNNAGTLVEIPKFYYQYVKSGNVLRGIRISMYQHEGFFVSPAHADRGDGIGERDYVYVGRYHCSSDSNSEYKSVSGIRPKVAETCSSFRSGIHNLGLNVWQNDFAMWWTIRMLYLVEFASWDSQTKIGYGCAYLSSAGSGNVRTNMGYTDSMPYHTGTIGTSRSTYKGIQYRYIEGLWDNCYDWMDGILHVNYDISCIKNPEYFTDTFTDSHYVRVATIPTYVNVNTDMVSAFGNLGVSSFEYAMCPSTRITNSSYNTYVCDAYYSSANVGNIYYGGSYDSQSARYGLFFCDYSRGQTVTYFDNVGSRLMVLPPSRLSPPTD